MQVVPFLHSEAEAEGGSGRIRSRPEDRDPVPVDDAPMSGHLDRLARPCEFRGSSSPEPQRLAISSPRFSPADSRWWVAVLGSGSLVDWAHRP